MYEVDGPSVVHLVDRFGEDHAGGAAIGRPSEVDAEGAHDERLVELLEIGITRICCDGAKRVAILLEMSLMSLSSDMIKGGRSARRVIRLM